MAVLDRYLTLDEVAAALGASRDAIESRIARRQIPSFRLWGRRLVDRVELEKIVVNARIRSLGTRRGRR